MTGDARAQKYIAEELMRRSMKDCELILGPDRFQFVVRLVVERLPALARERAAVERQDVNSLAVARAQDRTEVYSALFDGVNWQRLRRAKFPPDWCSDRDEAIARVGKAIRRLRSVLSRNTADPGLLLTSIEGLEREYRRFIEPWTVGPPAGAYDLGHELLTGRAVPAGRVGRPPAQWRHHTVARLRGIGVTEEAVDELIGAAGLSGTSPSRTNPKRRRKPKASKKS